MQFISISFEKVFPIGAYANEKLRADIIINEGESPMDAFDEARKLIDENFEKHNPHLVTPDIPSVTKRIIVPAEPENHSNKEIESMLTLEEQINSCTEVKVLESYKLIVKGKPEQKVYDKKLKELKKIK